jgi:hypothetical protein
MRRPDDQARLSGPGPQAEATVFDDKRAAEQRFHSNSLRMIGELRETADDVAINCRRTHRDCSAGSIDLWHAINSSNPKAANALPLTPHIFDIHNLVFLTMEADSTLIVEPRFRALQTSLSAVDDAVKP